MIPSCETMPWQGMVSHDGKARPGTACHGMPLHGKVWHGIVSVCIRMHPYASIRLIYEPNGNVQHKFSPKDSNSQEIVEIDFSIMRSGAYNRSK